MSTKREPNRYLSFRPSRPHHEHTFTFAPGVPSRPHQEYPHESTSHTPCLSFLRTSHTPCLSSVQRLCPLVQLFRLLNTSSHLPQSSIVKRTFQRSPLTIYTLIHSVYQIPFTTSIRCHLRPFSVTCTDPHFHTSST